MVSTMAANPSQTGVVTYGSVLQRRQWMLDGLLQKASNSWWSGLKGSSKESIVFVSTDASKGAGHEVVFQFGGNASGAGKVDKERLRGNEEQKKQFSDKIRVRRIRHGLDNGDEFDAVDIGNQALSTHADSRNLLADWYIRQNDQWLFDCAQGMANNESLTHIIRPNDRATIGDLTTTDTFGYEFLVKLEKIIKSSKGYTIGGKRTRLEPFTFAGGMRKWLLVLDSKQAEDLALDTTFQSIIAQGDVRGNDNRLIKGVLGTFRSFVIVEGDDFMGTTASRTISKSEVEVSGLRQINEDGIFSGEPGFETAGKKVASRAIILGAGALQSAFGRQPDYKFQSSDDYEITSGSAIELWTNCQATVLKAENGEYNEAKVSGFQYGIVAVDTYNSTNP